MSLSNQTNVVCPGCNKNMVVNIWSSLNIAQNPEVKEEILRGDFGKIVCPKCDTRINLVYGFLYHDPVKEFMIGVMSDFNPVYFEDPRLMPKSYTCRTVHNYDTLAEKIRIFDCGLNDIEIEVTKEIIRRQSGKDADILFSEFKDSYLHFVDLENTRGVSIDSKIMDIVLGGCDEEFLTAPEGFSTIDRNYALLLEERCK